MALFKVFRGKREDLDKVPKTDGHAYFCTDDGSFWIDHAEKIEEETQVLRTQINSDGINTHKDGAGDEYVNIAIGKDVVATEIDTVAIGSGVKIESENAGELDANGKPFSDRGKTTAVGSSITQDDESSYNHIFGRSHKLSKARGNTLIGDHFTLEGSEDKYAGTNVLIGRQSKIEKGDSYNTGIGYRNIISGDRNIVLGQDPKAFGHNEIYTGTDENKQGTEIAGGHNIVIGYQAECGKSLEDGGVNNSIAIGSRGVETGDDQVGYGASVQTDDSIAIGRNVEVTKDGSEGTVVMGRNLFAKTKNKLLLGDGKDITIPEDVAIALVAGKDSPMLRMGSAIDIGSKNTTPTDKSNISIGALNTSDSADGYSIAMGHNCKARRKYNITIGTNSDSGNTGSNIILVGNGNKNTSRGRGIAIGQGLEIDNTDKIVLGSYNKPDTNNFLEMGAAAGATDSAGNDIRKNYLTGSRKGVLSVYNFYDVNNIPTPTKDVDLTNKAYVDNKFNGANKAISFNNYATLINTLNDTNANEYQIGQNIYLIALNVPDLWISGKLDLYTEYRYENDDGVINDLANYGVIDVGYYQLSALETQKVDFTDVTERINEIDATASEANSFARTAHEMATNTEVLANDNAADIATIKADYIKSTDWGSTSKAGLLMVSNTWNNKGITRGNTTPTLEILPTTDALMDERKGLNPLVPKNIDYAVKLGLTTNAIELTTNEKAAARRWLGITSSGGEIDSELDIDSTNPVENRAIYSAISTVEALASSAESYAYDAFNISSTVEGKMLFIEEELGDIGAALETILGV